MNILNIGRINNKYICVDLIVYACLTQNDAFQFFYELNQGSRAYLIRNFAAIKVNYNLSTEVIDFSGLSTWEINKKGEKSKLTRKRKHDPLKLYHFKADYACQVDLICGFQNKNPGATISCVEFIKEVYDLPLHLLSKIKFQKLKVVSNMEKNNFTGL